MKKLLSFLFLIVMAFALAGCSLLGGGSGSGGGSTTIEVDFDEVFETISAQIPNKDNILDDVNLIRELGDVEITWTSSNVEVITNRGTVIRPEEDTEVILKCKLHANGITKEYEIRVIVKAEGGGGTVVAPLATINDVISGEVGATYKVRGTVVAISAINFIIKDKTGYILSYFEKGFTKEVHIGDELEVEGVTATYGGAVQFVAPNYELVGTGSFSQPDPRVLDAQEFDALKKDSIRIEYVTISGQFTKSGEYYNILITGATNTGSIAKTNDDLSNFVGKNVNVTGYFAYVSGSKYLYLVYTSIELSGEEPPVVIVENKTISEIKALDLNSDCKTEATVVATCNTSFLLQDSTDMILAYVGTTYAKDLHVGDTVEVSGKLSEYGGLKQIIEPVYTVKSASTVTKPNPRVLDKDAFAELETQKTIEFVEFEAVLRKSGSYTNLEVADVSLKGSILACDTDFTEFVDRTVKVQGYFVYVSGSSTKYANILLDNIALSENQSTPTLQLSTFAEVKAGTLGQTFLSKGIVIAVSNQSVLLKDETGLMYAYFGNTFAKDLVVGDEIKVQGATSLYNNAIQFNRPTYEKISATAATVEHPTAKALGAEEIEALVASTTAPTVEYVKITGLAKKSGNYLNVEIEGTTILGSLVYPAFDTATIDNKNVEIEGYYLYNSKSGENNYLSIICVTYTELTTPTPPPVTETTTISQVLAGTLGATYKTRATIVAMSANSIVLEDSTAKMLAYFATGYDATLVVGDVVEVNGTTSKYGGGTQFASPSMTKIEHVEYTYPTARTLDAAAFTNLKQESVVVEFVEFSGLLKLSGNYVNVEVTGSDLIGSLTSKDINFSELDNKHVKVTGYFTNSSGTQYLTIVVTAIQEEDVAGDALFEEIKADILSWNNANIYASMVLPTGDDSYTISWKSSNEAVFSSTGVVTTPTEDTVVTMTATLTVGEKTEDITFNVNICVLSDIATLLAIPETGLNGTYATKGYVYAKSNTGFLIAGENGVLKFTTDGQVESDGIYVYASGYKDKFALGDEVVVAGELKYYNGILEFFNLTGLEVTSNKKTINEQYYEINAEAIDSLINDSFMMIPVAVKGNLTVSGNYTNVRVGGTENIVSVIGASADYLDINGKDVIIKGYTIYVSGSKTKYLNILPTEVIEDSNPTRYALTLQYNSTDIALDTNPTDVTSIVPGSQVSITIRKLKDCNITSIKFNDEVVEYSDTLIFTINKDSKLVIESASQKNFEFTIEQDAYPTNPMYAYGYYWVGNEAFDEVAEATIENGKVLVEFKNIVPTFIVMFELEDNETAPNENFTNLKRVAYSFRASNNKEVIWQDAGSASAPKDLAFVGKIFNLADGYFRMSDPLHYVKATVSNLFEDGEYFDLMLTDNSTNRIRAYNVAYAKDPNLRLSKANQFVKVGDEIVFTCHIVNDRNMGLMLDYVYIVSVNGEELDFTKTYTFNVINGYADNTVLAALGYSATGETFMLANIENNALVFNFTYPQDYIYVCEYILAEGQNEVYNFYDYYRISERVTDSGDIILHFTPDVDLDRDSKLLTVNDDGTWTFHTELIVHSGIVDPVLAITDIKPFGYKNGSYGNFDLYKEESAIEAITDLSVTYTNGRYVIEFTLPKEYVDRYTKEYYYDVSYKGGIAIDYYGTLRSGNIDYTYSDQMMASIYYFNSFLDSVETEGKGTESSPLTSADALNVAAFLPDGVWSNDYFYVEGVISDEVTSEYANFHIGEGENAIYVYGCSTFDGQYKLGSRYNKVDSTLIKTGDKVLLYAQIHHYVSKDGVTTLELKDARIMKINDEAYEYTVKEEPHAQTKHSGTYEDPYDSADALAVAAFLEAGKTTDDFFFINGIISDEVTADYANFHIGEGDNAILVYGCYTYDGEYKIGSAYAHVASSLIKTGDLVFLQAKIQHYVDKDGVATFELKDARILLINKAEYTYELIAVSTEEVAHAGTYDDPFDAKDAIVLASKLNAENKEITSVRFYIKAVVTSEPTADYCNFTFTYGDRTILMWGLSQDEGFTQRYGSSREIADLPLSIGDEVMVYGFLQNYEGKLEVQNAQLISVVKAN